MNIKTLNGIVSVIKQRSDNFFDVSEWELFIKNVSIRGQHLTYISFVKDNSDICQVIKTCIVGGNLLLEDSIVITDINKDGCYDFYEEVSTASGIDKCILKAFL